MLKNNKKKIIVFTHVICCAVDRAAANAMIADASVVLTDAQSVKF